MIVTKQFGQTSTGRKHLFYRNYGKRFIDCLFAGILLLLLAPVFIIISALVFISNGAPVFFSPTRPGKHEKIFRLYKFRTMKNATDKEGKMLPEKDRITKIGKILRATSLDELPELINIFKGDMSFVGPRPFAMKYLPYYSEEERIRHEVRPGLTGLAQISGRNNLPWPNRFEKDLEYVTDMSLIMDISILMRTLKKLTGDSDVTIPGADKKYQFDTFRMIEEAKRVVTKPDALSFRVTGGHFWLEERQYVTESNNNWKISIPGLSDYSYTLSGRASITLAIRNIKKEKVIKKAYVPSYISFSMLQPFIQERIEYKFYDVIFYDGKVEYVFDKNWNGDLLYIVDYFGTDNSEMNEAVAFFQRKGCTVIEDITHSLLNKELGLNCTDFFVASTRKWFPIFTGGWIGKRNGKLTIKPNKDSSGVEDDIRYGMTEKRNYVYGAIHDKTNYTERIAKFESDLVQLDPMLKQDNYSINYLTKMDIDEISRIRRSNVRVLYEELSDLESITFLNSNKQIETNVPFFMPVLFEHNLRNKVKDKLMESGIICPIHWPETMSASSGIRNQELSIVCDQRYVSQDMRIIAEEIRSICSN